MEELNDVEFGSDKGTEEAPILVAQRYLNIFRQIHIFNKDKRTQFDDELLALPQNIIEFFKRMPGGRLLVEHIEDVKTERGISFVKSKREDFTNGADSDDVSGQNNNVSGGNMVMDASFAQTLATSMATVLKQTSGQTASGGTDSTILANLNHTFQLIAEEIKTSRHSLLEVLKETRQITDSVISSQMAISRLLENLCNNGTQISPITTRNTEKFTTQQSAADIVNNGQNNTERAISQNYEVSDSTSFGENAKKKKKKKKHNNQQDIEAQYSVSNSFSQQPATDIAIKSEKIAPAFSGIIRNVASKHDDDFANVKLDEAPLDDLSLAQFDNMVHNEVKQDFHTQEILANTESVFVTSEQEDNVPYNTYDAGNTIENISTELNDDFLNSHDLDFALPEQSVAVEEPERKSVEANGLDSLMGGDGLDFALPEHNVAVDEPEQAATEMTGLNSLMGGDGLNFALPEQSIAVEEQEPVEVYGLDSLMGGDGLDFALPEQSVAVEEPEQESIETNGLDSLTGGDGLDFALPEQSVAVEEPEQAATEMTGLDSLMGGDGLDFALPEQSVAVDEPEQESIETNGLDSLTSFNNKKNFGSDGLQNDFDTLSETLDNFIAQDNVNTVTEQKIEKNQSQEQYSRYSAELDKIRAALTSDNIDISSLDQPIELDDYSDDENIEQNENTDLESILTSAASEQSTPAETSSDEEDWEWEYVDENGNPIEGSDGEGEDWEWEYVEDDGQENEPDNNNK